MQMKIPMAIAMAAVSFFLAGCAGPGNVNIAGNSNVMIANGNANRLPDNSTASNASTAAKPAVMSDSEFMKEAAIGGMAEVELGRLAASKATSAEVKNFGQMMITDHSKANEDLKALAAKKNMQVPTEVDATHKSEMEQMKGRTGKDFDSAYVDSMVDDHEKDVAAFERESQSATDPDVKAFAAKTLPTLRKHLDAIRAIKAKMK